MEKRRRSNFSSFSQFFIYIFLTSGVKLHIHLLNVFVQFIDFLTLSTLICRGTDISKCFSESLGIRDNESRLYIVLCFIKAKISDAQCMKRAFMSYVGNKSQALPENSSSLLKAFCLLTESIDTIDYINRYGPNQTAWSRSTKSNQLLSMSQWYICTFDENMPTSSRDIVYTRNRHVNTSAKGIQIKRNETRNVNKQCLIDRPLPHSETKHNGRM